MGSSMDLSDKCVDPRLEICSRRKGLNGEGVRDELLAITSNVIITVGALLEHLLEFLFIPLLKLIVLY